MRICFVGHAFHKKTHSSAFFTEILRSLGTVDEFYGDPDGDPAINDAVIRALAGSRFDRYIFWQAEYILERLLPIDLGPAFIVPMYDSVVGYDEGHWRRYVNCRFLSFSRAHHEMLQRVGCATDHFQYFPPVGAPPDFIVSRGMRDGFFWERRPIGPVRLDMVLELCRMLGVERLHLHAAPDHEAEAQERVADDSATVAITVSRWFAAREDYADVAGRPLFFFAPRQLEGIGMSALEAMARGQIVVAPDLPVLNEYVAHGLSGFLYDLSCVETFRPQAYLGQKQLERMSRAAWRKAMEGRRTWLGDVERLKSIVAGDGRRWSTRDDSAPFVRAITRAAHDRVRHGD